MRKSNQVNSNSIRKSRVENAYDSQCEGGTMYSHHGSCSVSAFRVSAHDIYCSNTQRKSNILKKNIINVFKLK